MMSANINNNSNNNNNNNNNRIIIGSSRFIHGMNLKLTPEIKDFIR